MCSEDSKDINTTINNCPKWDCKQADKNKHNKNYNWLYRLSRTSSKFTVLRDLRRRKWMEVYTAGQIIPNTDDTLTKYDIRVFVWLKFLYNL